MQEFIGPNILTIISYFLNMINFIVIFGVYFDKKKRFEFAWFCTKISTIQKIVKDNAYKIQLFKNITEDGKINGLETNYYDLLKLASTNSCLGKYKLCGILDTLNHKLCIDKDYPCPINEIIADYSSEKYYYLTHGYNIRKVDYLTYNYFFYYTNYSIYENGIVILKRSFQPPKYIDYDNIYFDIGFINKFFGVNNSDNDLNLNLISQQKAYKRRIEGLDFKEIIEIVGEIFSIFKDLIDRIKDYIEDKDFEEFLEYVEEKIENDKNNIDQFYIEVGDNCYIKNYIGFETVKDIDIFLNTNFDIYKRTFPNKISAIFAIIGFIFCLFVIIACSIILCQLDKIGKKIQFCFLIIFFGANVAFFLGFIIYFSELHAAFHNKNVLNNIDVIKADEFITNFLKKFKKKIHSYHFVNAVITFFVFSQFLQIISFFVTLCEFCQIIL